LQKKRLSLKKKYGSIAFIKASVSASVSAVNKLLVAKGLVTEELQDACLKEMETSNNE